MNALTLLVLFTLPDNTYKKPSQRFIVSLTVADMLSGIPFYASIAIKDSFIVCETVLQTQGILLQTVSLWSLVGIAFDHYIAVCFPLRYFSLMTQNRVDASVMAMWIVCPILSCAPVVYPSMKTLFSANTYCQSSTAIIQGDIETGHITTRALYVFGTMLVFILYMRVFIEVDRYHRVHAKDKQSPNESRKSKLASLFTGLLILGGFGTFWLPMMIVGGLMSRDIHTGIYLDISRVWLQLNSLYDPLIYCLRMTYIRNGYKNVITKLKRIFPCSGVTDSIIKSSF